MNNHIYSSQYNDLQRRVDDAITFIAKSYSFKLLYFLNEYEIKFLQDYLKKNKNIKLILYSNIDNSEMKYAVLYHINYELPISNTTTTLFEVKYNPRFNKLDHRDLLGVLTSLKIDRKYIGDIIKIDDKIYFELSSHLINILSDIEKIGKTPVKFIENDSSIKRVQDYLSTSTTVKSFRLDIVCAAITNSSRGSVKELILSGVVKVNQIQTTNFSMNLTSGTVLSIKKYGRYLLEFNDNHTTKKGNYILNIHKYI